MLRFSFNLAYRLLSTNTLTPKKISNRLTDPQFKMLYLSIKKLSKMIINELMGNHF